MSDEAVTAGHDKGSPRSDGAPHRLIAATGLILVWFMLSLLVPARLVPSPWQTALAMVENFSTRAGLSQVAITLFRISVGFVLSLLIGVVVGGLMGLSRRVERTLDIWIVAALTIPGLVYTILALMWFGLSEFAAIFAIVVTAYPAMTINIWEGVKAIDMKLVEMARVFNAPPAGRFARVVLPQILPYVFASARVGLGSIWKVTVIVELLGMSSGVGYMLHYWFQLYDMRQVFAWTMTFVLIILFIELVVITRIERRLFGWREAVSL
jgi:NitT/TauT family transport system permease protein